MGRNARGFAKLDSIIAKIHRLSTGEFQRQAIDDVAQTMYELSAEGIAARQNPRGRPWRALSPRSKHAGEDPLRITAANLHKAVTRELATLTVAFPHAKAHLGGAGNALHDARTGKRLSREQVRSLKKGQAKELVAAGALKRGGWKLPARSFLPKGGRLPPKWRAAIEKRMRARFGELWGT